MTVAATTRKAQYDGNDSAVDFAIPFIFYDNADIRVIHRTTAGVETVPVLNTDYTVTGGSGAVGSVEFPIGGSAYSTLASGSPDERLTITDGKDTERDADIAASYQFGVLNQVDDKTMTMLQNLQRQINLCIRGAETDSDSLDMRLVPDILRTNSFIFLDDTGVPVTVPNSSQSAQPAAVVPIVAATADVVQGDGVGRFIVPSTLNGMNLIRAQGVVVTAGTTNATTIQIHNVDESVDMLSALISVASGQKKGTVGTITLANAGVSTDDELRFDADTVSTTAPKGLFIILEFQLPS